MPGRITSATFVGRKDQLESLLEVFDATLTGPAVVLLGGGGRGRKDSSRDQFVRRIAGTRVLVGACLELGQAVMPFAPLAGVLRQLSRTVGPEETADRFPWYGRKRMSSARHKLLPGERTRLHLAFAEALKQVNDLAQAEEVSSR